MFEYVEMFYTPKRKYTNNGLQNQTPAEARRTPEQFEVVSAPDALAQNNDEDYETQTCKLSL